MAKRRSHSAPTGVDSQEGRVHLSNYSKAKNTAFRREKKMPKSSPHQWLPTKKKKKKQWPRVAVPKISESVRKNYGPK